MHGAGTGVAPEARGGAGPGARAAGPKSANPGGRRRLRKPENATTRPRAAHPLKARHACGAATSFPLPARPKKSCGAARSPWAPKTKKPSQVELAAEVGAGHREQEAKAARLVSATRASQARTKDRLDVFQSRVFRLSLVTSNSGRIFSDTKKVAMPATSTSREPILRCEVKKFFLMMIRALESLGSTCFKSC